MVFDEKGQNNDGGGHDVFYGIPYERINKIRIVDVSMDAKHVSILSDATAAYEPEVGVKKFTRNFEFKAPGSFTVTDNVKTISPKIITSFLHADNTINQISANTFELEPNKTSLVAEIIEPKLFEARVDSNILTAPGDPGSVDKGGDEERGKKLAISTKDKVLRAKFILELTIKEEK